MVALRSVNPFRADDLAELDERLLARAERVVTMRQVADGETTPGVVGLRHDVDNSLDFAVRFAEWEHARGYRSTYFILHTAPYWRETSGLRAGVARIAELGHEIGIHTNAISEALLTGRDPDVILDEALELLRSWGHEVRGTVGHGDALCQRARFVNDEHFTECARPDWGEPKRTLTLSGWHPVALRPRPLADFGLDYCSAWLPRAAYLSDSGGRWSTPFDEFADAFPYPGQAHVLIHACWWGEAFA